MLSQPRSGCEIPLGLWWTVGGGGAAWDRAIARAKALRERAGPSSPISERKGSKILLLETGNEGCVLHLPQSASLCGSIAVRAGDLLIVRGDWLPLTQAYFMHI